MKYSGAEVKSGILIFITIVLLFGITFLVGKFTAGSTTVWKIRFGYIGGLEEKSPVHYAGRQVGKVQSIQILPGEARPVLVSIRISSEVKIRTDSKAYIDTLGLLGEKFVEITTGDVKSPDLAANGLIEGVDPVPIYQMMQKMDVLADQMEELMKIMNPMLLQMNGYLSGEGENIAKIIANTHEISANLRDMTRDLKYRPWRLVRKD